MTVLEFLLGWALRSSVLLAGGALVLFLLRVKDASVRLAAWTAMLAASLAIPALMLALPKLPLTVAHTAPVPAVAPAAIPEIALQPLGPAPAPIRQFDWAWAAIAIYAAVALTLLVRLAIGWWMARRLVRSSVPTGRTAGGIELRESNRVASPVTLGILRPAIVLPADWREWDQRTLDAVLAHEGAHVRRRDPLVQSISRIHRALLWHSPLSWLLHRGLVRTAEEASDDAAIAATGDRTFYAEVLLAFIGRGLRRVETIGISMARYDQPERRIHRILDGVTLSRGLTWRGMAATLAVAAPLAYFAAAATPQTAPAAQKGAAPAAPPAQAPVPAAPPGAQYLMGLGTVTPSASVTVRPRIDGELQSVSFKEGETVQAGEVLATLDPRPFQFPVTQAQLQVAQDEAELNRFEQNSARAAQLKGKLESDRANLAAAELQMSYTKIVAPITGVAGLRQIDSGNMVHSADPKGIVVITQVQPIAVVFTLAEDALPKVLPLMNRGADPIVEAWNRDNSAKFATGRLMAVDNQIDTETGTAKLKAEFENKDRVLYPGEFVNIRILVR